ncbi:MAG: polysaccharide lyase beta-sandwich domain-containing protein, partial [Hungatella sp.]
LHMTGVNFWEDKPYTVKDLTVNKNASVMMQEQVTDGILNIAVSDPTMMNTTTIEVGIAKPGVEVVSQDPNVEVTLEDGKILLTVSVKGKNGQSSYASVKLASTIDPEAMTVLPGGTAVLRAIAYGTGTESYLWKVASIDSILDKKTVIENGILTVAEEETSCKLLVTATADGDSSKIMTARVNVAQDEDRKVTEAAKEIFDRIDELQKQSEDGILDLTDPATQEQIKTLRDTVASASNAELSVNPAAVERIVGMEALYQDAFGIGATQSDIAEDVSDLLTLTNIEGAALSVPYKASASDATPSNAILRFSKASDSNATADSVKFGKKQLHLDKNNMFSLQIQLDIVDADGRLIQEGIQPLAPIRITMEIPPYL